jgi:hypothetical protein
MDVSKLHVEDYEGGSLIHRALANVCVNAKLNHYSLPLGFHRKFFDAIWNPLLYHTLTLRLSNKIWQITLGPGSSIRSEKTLGRGRNEMRNGLAFHIKKGVGLTMKYAGG